MSSKSLYETFGNEVSYEQRRGKLVQFIENNTINFDKNFSAYSRGMIV